MSLDKLKSALGKGARNNKYRVYIAGIDGVTDTDIDVLCKSTSLPGVTIKTIEVASQGRKLRLAGDKEYEGTWEATFYNTQDMKLKKSFEDWMNKIDNFGENTREKDTLYDYSYVMTVEQLDGNDSAVATYVIYDAWPSGINAIELADDGGDGITEFTVTFAYSYWERVL